MVGRENVFCAVFAENRHILDVMDVIQAENVIELRHDNIVKFASDVWSFITTCRKHHIDAIVDMEFFSRASAILGFLSGAGMRAGLHRFSSEVPYRGDLLTHKIQYNPFLHTSKAYLQLVESLVSDPAQVPMMKLPHELITVEVPRFNPVDKERDRVLALLSDKLGQPPERPIVIFNPNAGDMLPLRKWDSNKFVGLGKKLADAADCTIVITGASTELQEAKRVAQRIGKNCVSVAGDTSLRDLIILYTIADLLITNDSGPGHFSALTDIKTIILFGPETPGLFGPLGTNQYVIWKNLTCSPCVNPFNHRFSPCTDNVCMQNISVEEVYEKSIQLLRLREKGSVTNENHL